MSRISPARAPERGLNVAFIKGLKAQPDETAYEIADVGETHYLRVRISCKSKRFYMRARWKKGASSASSRAIGEFSETEKPGFITLAQARETARNWEALRKAGIDPKASRSSDKSVSSTTGSAAGETATAPTFRDAAEDYLGWSDFQKLRSSATSTRRIKNNLLDPAQNPWCDKPLADIDDADIATVIANIRERPAPAIAQNVLDHIRQIFTFAVKPERRKKFGIRIHPIAHLRPRDFGLSKNIRKTFLDDREIVSYWKATDKMGYPEGPFYQLLLLFGVRIGDLGPSKWSEFDLRNNTFTVPEQRFKSDAQHRVFYSDFAAEIINSIPRFNGTDSGDYVFSKTSGRTPMNSFSKMKSKLDELMLFNLREQAKAEGIDANRVSLKKFVNHDTRRVVRSNLPKLGVSESVAEMVIGHGKKGLERIYNQYQYEKEMRQALQIWADHVRGLISRG